MEETHRFECPVGHSLRTYVHREIANLKTMIIGIIIFAIFAILLTKAIIETIWGTCLLIYGFVLHAIAYCLEFIVWIVELFSTPKQNTRRTPQW